MFGKKSGGNAQRENFGAKASAEPMGKAKPEPKTEGGMGEMHEGGETKITHNGDGSHSVDHADGEHSDHPSTAHMVMHLHGKHAEGEAMHVHNHGGMEHGAEGKPVTTHHHGHDGMVEGPDHHDSMDAAAEHMKQTMGEDGGNGAALGGEAGISDQGNDLY
jgi:hypothetical protein